jgi:signal transduction histidine kinase
LDIFGFMNPKRLSVLFFFFSLTATAQSPIDSIISRLQDKNLILLNKQLYQLVDHDLFRRIKAEDDTWPGLTADIATKAVERSREFDPAARAMVMAHMAEVLTRTKEVALGYELINKALKAAAPIRGQPKAYVYYKYADVFKYVNRLDSAIFYAERSLDIATEIKNDSIEKAALEQVAGLCYKVKNNAKAELYFKRLAIHPLADDGQRRNCFNTIGLTFRRRQLYDSAIYYFTKSLSLVPPHDTAWVGLLNGNIGYTYFLLKKYDKALPGLLKDVDYSFRSRSYSSAHSALSTVVSLYIIRKDAAHARIFYDSLAHQMTPGLNKDELLEFYRISSDYYKFKGDMNRSLNFLESYITLNDSLQDLQNALRASELDAQFDFERQVKKISNLEIQNQLHADEDRLKNYLLLGTSVFILLGVGLIYVLYRNNRFKNATNKLLQGQNAQIREQTVRLNELNTTKDKLFSIISHDLRGPINSLKALMDMVKKQMVTEAEFRHFSGQLQNNVEYVHFTLENLLQWSRSQLHGILTRPALIKLNVLVEENFKLLSEPAALKSITLMNMTPVEAEMFADPDQMRVVLRNLISNAIKFTNEGGCITVSSTTSDNREIVTVKDTGTGISDGLREKLFQANTNHSSAGTAGEKGTGIGLSLCKEMIEKNNGSIWVESIAGEGTSFMFSLPKA